MRAPVRHPFAARFRTPAVLLGLALAYGIGGYHLLFGWSLLDASYMTVITLTTVGFREVRELTDAGRLFTMSLVLTGVVTLFAAVTIGTELLASGEVAAHARGRRTRKRMDKLRDHFIICAFGRVGRAAADEMDEHGLPYVVIDSMPELRQRLDERGCPYILGDPADEEVLRQAGIERARGLVCAVDSDATNVFITLTARTIKSDLLIVTRASNARARDKLERAGADRVVSPYELSGRRMALMVSQPSVVDFFDTGADGSRMEEIRVRPGSPLDGRTVGDVTAAHPGVTVMAVKNASREIEAPPSKTVTIEAGDLVLVLGPPRALNVMSG